MRHGLLTTTPLLWLALLAPAAAGAAELRSTLADQEQVAVTIYNDDLALVRDLRRVALPLGEGRLALRDVSAQIRPETALLKNLQTPGALAVREQNFDFDLLTPEKLLEKYVGRSVKVVRLHPASGAESEEAAEVLAVQNGVVLRIGARIETGVPGRIVYPEVPENLRDRPTLVVDFDNGAAAPQLLELSYLSGGLSWRADYVALLDGRDERLDLSAWVTLTNRSGSSYRNARLQLVAGDVHRTPAEAERLPHAKAALLEMAAAPALAAEELFEYHLYTLDRPTSLAENQTKQVALLTASGVPVRKEFVLRGSDHYYSGSHDDLGRKLKVATWLEFGNDASARLGVPLPKGVVRVYKQDRGGSPQFVGEDRVDHTAKGEKVRLKLGEAFDLSAERKQTDFKKLAGSGRFNYVFESAFRIELRNAKDEAVTVRVEEPLPGDWEVLKESLPHRKEAAGTAVWQVPVPAGASQVLEYRVRVRY